jgi:hypothetical protein
LRVTPDRQTLILAGEVSPRRAIAGSSATARDLGSSQTTQRVTVFSARVDAVLTESEYASSTTGFAYDSIDDADFKDVSPSALPASAGRPSGTVTPRQYAAYATQSGGARFNGADSYARTQDLADRHPIIDTYA